MKRKGLTLIELMVAIAILGFVAAGFMQMSTSIQRANAFSTAMPTVQEDAIRVVNLIAADVRRAPLCTASSGCTQDAAVHSGTNSSITVYSNSSGAQRLFSRSGNTFQVVNGTSSPATTILDVTGLEFSYCVNSGLQYNMTSSPDSATWVTSLSGSNDLKGLIAVKITATVSRNGLTGSYSTVVRLRNSPKKTNSM